MTYSIYISGPIMAPNPDRPDGLVTEELLAQRREKFNVVSQKIRGDGSYPYSTLVINPLEVEACKSGTTAPVCDAVDQDQGHTWQCYLRYDLEALVMCHKIILLPGWENSPGANVEFQVANMLKLEVKYWCDKHELAHFNPSWMDCK